MNRGVYGVTSLALTSTSTSTLTSNAVAGAGNNNPEWGADLIPGAMPQAIAVVPLRGNHEFYQPYRYYALPGHYDSVPYPIW